MLPQCQLNQWFRYRARTGGGLPQVIIRGGYAIERWNLQPDPARRRSPLKYLCLVYGEEKQMGAMTDDECMAYDQALRNSGRCLASEALQPVRTAATVRVRNGKVSVTDGPFTETKECLAGFYLIEAADLNEATKIAAQIPPARVGSIEVRPVRELTSTTGQRRQL